MSKEAIATFIRWQKKGNRKYAHLEGRKRVGGKVVTNYIAYLGADPRGKLIDLLIDGVITQEEYDKLSKGLPEPPKAEEKPPGLVEQLKAELNQLNERDIMAEFPDLSSHVAHVDGVRYMLKKLEAVKTKFPEVWEQRGKGG